MILGLPWTSWLLLIVAVGSGLGIAGAFYLAHRSDGGGESAAATASRDPTSGPG